MDHTVWRESNISSNCREQVIAMIRLAPEFVWYDWATETWRKVVRATDADRKPPPATLNHRRRSQHVKAVGSRYMEKKTKRKDFPDDPD